MDAAAADVIRRNPKFVELERKRNSFSWILSILMLVIYYGYILLVAFAPAYLGQSLFGHSATSLGMLIGLGVILSAIVLTGVYVVRANGEFDRLTREIAGGIR